MNGPYVVSNNWPEDVLDRDGRLVASASSRQDAHLVCAALNAAYYVHAAAEAARQAQEQG